MARDAFHAVKSMSILCLWDIQLTFDRNGVGTYGAYHHKSELKRCNRVQIFFNPPKFAVVIAILEPANSTRTDNCWPAVHVCEGSLQVARLSAILLYIFLGKIFCHC